jgi:hypothetical protein
MINSIDILKTKGPVLDYYTHMNKLYMFLEKNSECFRGQDYATLTVTVTSYGEKNGKINLEDPRSSWSQTYQQFEINTRYEPEDLAPYNIWVQLENFFYGIELYFNYGSKFEGSGTIPFQSQITKVYFDNRKTTLTGRNIGKYIKGYLKDNLYKEKEFSVWSSIRPISLIKKNDIVVDNKFKIFQRVDNINGSGFQVVPADQDYIGLLRFIVEHPDLPQILKTYFGSEIAPPPLARESYFTFKIQLGKIGSSVNDEVYQIHFRGDLQYLIDKEKDYGISELQR